MAVPGVSVVAVLIELGLILGGGAGVANAANRCGSGGVFSHSGRTATCTYTIQGTEGTFSVPAGVRTLRVTAIGAPGGSAGGDDVGGVGAKVANAALPLRSAPSELYVDVGQAGGDTFVGTDFCESGSGGAFDGGGGGSCGAGGGGSSAILIVPRARANLTGNPRTDSRLLVAAGGGGGGGNGVGGSAGDQGVTGAGAGGCDSAGGIGGVGPTDGSNGGGTSSCGGTDGTASVGGAGAGGPELPPDGGGGGGWFGGGGGGTENLFGGGGGGGSSYGGGGRSAGITIEPASSTATPEVVISWIEGQNNDNNN
jgi:hypothetical protein